ncbi:unnamed protein product, partial [Aphanomyces euteiches]
MSIREEAPAEKTQPTVTAEEAPPAVQGADPGSEEETKSEEIVATEPTTAPTQEPECSRSPSWGPLPTAMTKVQRELFQQLADDVPQDTKEPKDLTRDKYVVIHHKVVLYEAAMSRYQIPDKPQVSKDPRMDTEWMEPNQDFDDPFLVDDDELRAAKKKVGQMLGIKKVKITKAQRKQIEEEAMADNKHRAEEMEEQRRSGHDIQIPPYDSQRAKEVEDAWTRGMPPSNHPIPGGGWAHIAEGRREVFLNVSDLHDVTYPQDETARCRDDDLHHVDDLGADRQCDKPDKTRHLFLSSHIKAPEIESFDREHLVAWLKKRTKYESDVRSAATEHGMAWQSYTKKWMDSIPRNMLEVLCKIKLKIDICDLTEERFQQYIRNIVETRPTMKRPTECEIKKALNDVLMKTKGDVNSRLLDFMDQLYTAVKDNCLQQSMEEKDCRKVFIRIAITKIRPLTLQGQVRENYNVDPRRHKLEGLSELIEEQMEIHRTAEELVEKHAMTPVKREREDSFSSVSPSPEPKTKFRRPHDHKDTGSPEASHRSRQGDLQANTHHNQRISKYGPTSGKDDKPKVKFDVKPSGVCYNCRKPGHLMANCPDRTSSSERKVKKIANAASRNRYMQRKKAKRAKNDSGQERFININSALDCLYCPDTGAEIDVIPKSILKQLQAKCPNLEIVQLREPLRGIGCNDQGFEAHAYVELSLTMQTSAGAVRVPGKRKCYIVAEGDELLVSDQTLRLVGINIDRLLAETAQRMANEEDDLEAVDFENPRLRRRLLGPWRPARFGLPKPKTELETALAAMVQEACDDGFPVDLAGRLWKALTKHDIWRLKLNGSDPPAKVEPLKVTPREGCEP